MLVTQDNVAQIALRKLGAIADLPSRLVGVNRQREEQRITQLEAGLAINRRLGSILDGDELQQEIADLIRTSYDYDHVQIFVWAEDERALILHQPGVPAAARNSCAPVRCRRLGPRAVAQPRHLHPRHGALPALCARPVLACHPGAGRRAHSLRRRDARRDRLAQHDHAPGDQRGVGQSPVAGRSTGRGHAQRRTLRRGRPPAPGGRTGQSPENPAAGQCEPRVAHAAQRHPRLQPGGHERHYGCSLPPDELRRDRATSATAASTWCA
ncbi:MAG: hypothetical protein R2838_10630 [Caldilineaceae bacterium]